MKMILATVAMSVLFLLRPSSAKVFSKCELAKELVRHGMNRADIPNWICLIQHESSFNTRSKGGPNRNGSYDHGLFQINDNYWCSPPARNNDCKISCSNLRDDNIADDVKCAKLIYRRHKFNAWYGWVNNCKGKNLSGYVRGCTY
uniref:lysozyme n=1 Tax=Liphistius thaleban TaxID=1905330 RepID=A0A4Q8K2I4_9ARAC